jgi:hypothetical protein
MSEEVAAVRIPGGEAALSKSLRAFFAQSPPHRFQTFYSVLLALTIYYTEKGEKERKDYSEVLDTLFELIDSYSRVLNSYYYSWQIGAPIQKEEANMLTDIINKVFRSGLIPSHVLSEVIEVAAETMIKKLDREILLGEEG